MMKTAFCSLLFSTPLAASAQSVPDTAPAAEMKTVDLLIEDTTGDAKRVRKASVVLVNGCSSVKFSWEDGDEEISVCPVGGDAARPILSFEAVRTESDKGKGRHSLKARVTTRSTANQEMTVVSWDRPGGNTRMRASWHP